MATINAKTLATKVEAFGKAYISVMTEIHPLTMSVLAYTAQSGRADIFNRLHSFFKEPERLALRQWLTKHDGSKWLKYDRENNVWSLINVAENEKAKLARDEFVAREGEYTEGEPFYVKVKGAPGADIFDNTKALARITSVVKSADKDDSHASPEMKAFLKRMLKEAELIEAEGKVRQGRAELQRELMAANASKAENVQQQSA